MTTARRLKRLGYAKAVQWIADNDAPGDDDSAEDMFGYLTVALASEVYDVPQETIARDVWAFRHSNAYQKN